MYVTGFTKIRKFLGVIFVSLPLPNRQNSHYENIANKNSASFRTAASAFLHRKFQNRKSTK